MGNNKIMIVMGSPRAAGNTAQLAQWVAEGAIKVGAQVEIVSLANTGKPVSGCVSCYQCQRSEAFRCVINDQYSEVIAKIPQMDIVVLASPVYFHGPTSQIKAFIDRMYSLLKFKPEGMQCAFNRVRFAMIATCGQPDLKICGIDLQEILFRRLNQDRHVDKLVYPGAPHDPKETAANEDLKRRAFAFGAKLFLGVE